MFEAFEEFHVKIGVDVFDVIGHVAVVGTVSVVVVGVGGASVHCKCKMVGVSKDVVVEEFVEELEEQWCCTDIELEVSGVCLGFFS